MGSGVFATNFFQADFKANDAIIATTVNIDAGRIFP